MNYPYFVNQLTTFLYLPINFGVIYFKFIFLQHITPDMGTTFFWGNLAVKFPKWKFAVMAFFDSMHGLILVVGGVHVPGIIQSLLLQAVVPITMLFSLLMLRYNGDYVTRTMRSLLKSNVPRHLDEHAECLTGRCLYGSLCRRH